jgi:hypothetical protein
MMKADSQQLAPRVQPREPGTSDSSVYLGATGDLALEADFSSFAADDPPRQFLICPSLQWQNRAGRLPSWRRECVTVYPSMVESMEKLTPSSFSCFN